MKILVDMNLSPDWVEVLRESVSQAVHWSAIGSSNAADTTITEYARREGFVILTQDMDFGAILAASGDISPSVILLRAGRVTPSRLGLQVISAIQRLRDEFTAGAFVTVEPKRTRITVLPLRNRTSE
jgi:predicted nuclease of predicted toxin-antitoxin system